MKKTDKQLSGIERLIVGVLTSKPETFRAVRDILRPEMFANANGREIAGAIWHSLGRGKFSFDIAKSTLSDWPYQLLVEAHKAAMVRSETTDDLIEAAEILSASWAQARFDEAIQQVIVSGDTADWKEKNAIIESARQDIAGTRRMAVKSREEVLDDIVADMFAGVTGKKSHSGIATGFADLDDMTGGWEAGQQIVVGGRPGMGKTRWALMQALQAARSGVPAAIISMEMTSDEVYKTALSWVTKIPVSRIRTYNYTGTEETDAISDAAKLIKTWPIHLVDNLRYAEDVQYAVRELHQRHSVGFVMYDYLQLMYGREKQRNSNRNNELTEMSAGFKGLAKELRFVSVMLSQLNREVDKRSNRRPIMADLRDSGAIEADADVIIFPWRENPDDPTGPAEIIVAKQRGGKTGAVQCHWEAAGFYADGSGGHAPASEFDGFEGKEPAYAPITPNGNGHDVDIPF